MPPSQPHSPASSQDPSHMLPPHAEKSFVGPFVGAVIIILLLAFGGLYFWGAYLNTADQENNPPRIRGNDPATLQQ